MTLRRAFAVVVGVAGAACLLAVLGSAPAAASEVCGTTTVASAYNGACATFEGVSGWFGTYGPGFPTATGWALAAGSPAPGPGPSPAGAYSAAVAPVGSDTGSLPALGYALGEATAAGAWAGGASFSADDAAVAAELLYDHLVWGAPSPLLAAGELAAYDELEAWFAGASGATGSPTLDMNTTGIGPVPTAGAIYQVRLVFPGSGAAASGVPVTLTLHGGTFAGGATAATLTTDSLGDVSAEVYADSSSTPVTVDAAASVGALGLQFLATGAGDEVVSPESPVTTSNSDTIAPSGQPAGTGTVSVDEGGDDVAYLGLSGGVYQVVGTAGTVVATLTTNSSGAAGPSLPLPAGTYTVRESTAPLGYAPGPDQTVTVLDGGNVTAHFTGANENTAIPATLDVNDTDEQTGVPLAYATFDIRFDSQGNGSFGTDLGTCTTDAQGTCQPPSNDGASFLPGKYLISEVGPAPGYAASTSNSNVITLEPGATVSLSIQELLLGSLTVSMTGNDTAYYPVGGAQFEVSGPAPSNGLAGTVTVGASGPSGAVGGLEPGIYTLTETKQPPGYAAVPPFDTSVSLGHATTVAHVADSVDPGTLDVYNVASGTSAPVVGGVFDVRYDATASGVYGDDLGECTTSSIGACSPSSGGAIGLLPGRYEVTEVSAPPGYAPGAGATSRYVVLAPGSAAVVDFADPRLVAVEFAKHPTGNVDPVALDVAGARLVVDATGSPGGAVATCTTDGAGTCTTQPALVPGDRYCWVETVAPPGFVAGESGCLVAASGAGTVAVAVDEPGEFVEVTAAKVDAIAPGGDLAGATLDLYRMVGGSGPPGPPPPAGAPTIAGGTWVASVTSGSSGPAVFPLELPGYRYCVVEGTPPPGYQADRAPRCTPVLAGRTSVPPETALVTLADVPLVGPGAPPPPAPGEWPPKPDAPAPAPAPTPVPAGSSGPPAVVGTVTIRAHKFDSLAPASAIGGAVYDLYVVGPPLSSVPPVEPGDPTPRRRAGEHWVERGRTDAAGNLSFVVPSGRSWCLVEVSAPPDFVADPRARCTPVLGRGSPPGEDRVLLPERPRMVDIQAHKFNSLEPDTGIPGAVYAVFSVGGRAPGARPARGFPVPRGVPGGAFYELGVTGRDGEMVLEVPAGYAWCLKEVRAPPGYRFDPALHCTVRLTARQAVAPVEIALPEIPSHLPMPARPPAPPAPAPPTLPFTGLDVEPMVELAGALALAGAVLLLTARGRGRGRGRGRRRGEV
ncbi:MAG: SpaA isopeptide-forming pilin-related protein [Actinomycetota bacterium]|nr:SpaA isopeptide-forming pilin-related protein [Actinomycetota bacterium]